MAEEMKTCSRTEMIEAARSSFLKYGVEDTTIASVAEELHIDEKAIVDEFFERQELCYEVLDKIVEDIAKGLLKRIDDLKQDEMSGMKILLKVIQYQYEYVFEHQELTRVINEINHVAAKENVEHTFADVCRQKHEFFRGAIQGILERGIEDGSIRNDIDVLDFTRFLAEEMFVRLQGMMYFYITTSDRQCLLPVRQMKFYLNLIEKELEPDKSDIYLDAMSVETSDYAYDPLTGLLGKEAFFEKAYQKLCDNPDKEYEIVVTDIEKFKMINDNYGMQEGDRVLKYIASRISELTTPEDSACCRMGVDKFFVLLEHTEGKLPAVVDEAVEDIRRFAPDMNITLKFGVYRVTDKNLPIAFMCDRAILAVDSIKGKYNIKCAYYDDSLRRELIMEQKITNEMENALADEQFEVYFQPKYDLLTETIAGAEALVRWNHPKLGFVSPAAFVPVFEKNGFITRMDMYVWEKTCEYLASWKQAYGMNIPISVNVSRRDIYNGDLPKIFLNLIKKYGLDIHDLHLEITESAYTEESEQLIGVINELKANGFVIEMDDFGSGYSSLNMLSEIPIDILKLDMRFVQGKDLANNRNIMNFVMGLAKWMNLLVVAEGVETIEQINVLKALECNYVQGYFYSKPLPAGEFASQLEAKADSSEVAAVLQYEGENAEVYIQNGASDRVILVVDSVLWNCNLIYAFFKDTYTVAYTRNGTSAWNYILDHHDTLELVIIDLGVQNMNGMELIMKIRSDKNFAAIPIIATAQFGQGGEEMALTLGASDFVQKPYGRGVMIRRVQSLLLQKSVLKSRGAAQSEEDIDKAKIDPATGLFTQERLESAIYSFVNTQSDREAVFLVIDIDDFRNITEEYGYALGEMVIKNVVTVLKKSFRKDEIISHSGGDEFCVFLPEEFTTGRLHKRMERLLKDLQLEMEDRKVTCSVGVCRYPQEGDDYESMYAHGKEALTKAKKFGKNQYQVYGGE